MSKVKVKEFLKDHKKEIIMAGVGVALIVGGIIIGKKIVPKGCFKGISIPLNDSSMPIRAAKYIDEEIFTELAPTIEAAVLGPDINTVIERSYDVGQGIFKMVTVNIEEFVGD